jgi:hypothetical protein
VGPIYHATSTIQALIARYGQQQPGLEDLTDEENRRLALYMKLMAPFTLREPTNTSVPLFKKTAYSYDFWRCLGRPEPNKRFRVQFGDVREVPEVPTFVKSRPICQNNENSVLLPLEMDRHFYFPKDPFHWEQKTDMAIFRGACHQPWRKRFLHATRNSRLVDAGDTSRSVDTTQYQKPFMRPQGQMQFKFIISLEGNDVASNLKWAMNSNSVVIMPKPKFETWFCESVLEPDVHYLNMADDLSDVDRVIEHALENREFCQTIRENANAYCRTFLHMTRQYQLGRFVVDKYMSYACQR